MEAGTIRDLTPLLDLAEIKAIFRFSVGCPGTYLATLRVCGRPAGNPDWGKDDPSRKIGLLGQNPATLGEGSNARD